MLYITFYILFHVQYIILIPYSLDNTNISFGCQHFHFTFWFLWAVIGLILAIVLLPLSYYSINYFVQYSGLFERINTSVNILLLVIGLVFVWVLKCNKL